MTANVWQQVASYLDDLYTASEGLGRLFPGRKFTLDGHLVGSVGEVIAAYMFELASDTSFGAPIVSRRVGTTSIKLDKALEPGTYFWRVRALEPEPGDWSTIANVTVVEEEAPNQPPMVVEEVPPPAIQIPPASPDMPMPPTVTTQNDKQSYFMAYIIGIGAVGVIFFVVLASYLRSRRRKVLAVEYYKQKLNQWEVEGYDISKYRDRWFKN